MKTSIPFLAGWLSLTNILTCSAQSAIDLGMKGGLSIPNLTSANDANPINDGYGSRLGIDAAIFVEFHLSKNLSFQPQLEYSSQGGKKKGMQAFSVPPDLLPLFPEDQVPDYLYASYNSTAKINYLMFPLLTKYRVRMSSHWDFYIAAGPFVSVVISAKNETWGNSQIYLDESHTQALPIGEQSFDRTEKIKKDLQPINAGINGHIGFSYLMNKSSIFIEGGGNYGFINIQKDQVNGKNKTGAAVAVVGYQFNIRRK